MGRGVLGRMSGPRKSSNWSQLFTAVKKLAVLIALACMTCPVGFGLDAND